MNISMAWLNEFVDFELTPAELRDLITSRVATVDEVISLRDDLRDIVVGRVVEVRAHPNSDHLHLTKVDAGTGELLDVVCGAPNVAENTLYPFAPVGATLPGGLKIEKRKIRGESSTGMLCSARELGLGGDHTGILALDLDVAPGTPFLQAMPVGDTRLVVDVLANRPDLLSHRGIAREVAAATGGLLQDGAKRWVTQPVRGNTIRSHERVASSDGITVQVDDPKGCPLYCAYIVRGVKVGPSPDWLREHLEAVGARSINNVVDATNYMLLGYGQPMHAFDARKLGGNQIVVRRAHEGERLRTLDGVDRTLKDDMLVIADHERAQAVAGVIGGADSEVDETTTDVVLEVAVFDAPSIRRTRRALGVSTDASYRFERGVDAAATSHLGVLAVQLIQHVAGGAAAEAFIKVGIDAHGPNPLTLRGARVATLLGESVAPQRCAELLKSIGFGVDSSNADCLRVTPPSWRSDVTLEVDVIEEVARLHGYDTFSKELRPFRPSAVPDASAYTVSKRVAESLVAAGMYEVRPIPFVSDAGERGVRVMNPLVDNEAMLRSNVLDTLARRVEHNFAHMTRTVRLFEVGVAFERSNTALPSERTLAAAVITGDRYPAHFTNAKPPQVDLWDAKWIAETIGRAAFGAERMTLAPAPDGNGWNAQVGDAVVGVVQQIDLDAPVWASPVYGVEIDITAAFDAAISSPRYRPLPTTPAAEFDLALLVPDSISAEDVDRAIRKAAGDLLESLVPFDEFRGEGVGAGMRSVAWRLTLRHPERTLKDKEIEGRRAQILRTLDQELGVRPRSA